MATLAEIEPVQALLSNLLIGEPLTHGALTVVPLLAPAADEPDWLTLAEAGDRVRVTEVSEAGTVPFLKVANLADRPLLLLDGEQLVGAKQNRVLNTTVLVAAESELTISVSCVERGRWGYRRREMSPSDVSLYASVRRRKSQWVSEALLPQRAMGGPRPPGRPSALRRCLVPALRGLRGRCPRPAGI